jgi:ribosome-binding protein aMBF1 (putative translation factor)
MESLQPLEGTAMSRAARTRTAPKRDTSLNMYPVSEAPPEVHEIYKRCRDRGISMRQLCIKVGVHHDVVARWRRGTAQPTLRIMRKLLEGLEA